MTKRAAGNDSEGDLRKSSCEFLVLGDFVEKLFAWGCWGIFEGHFPHPNPTIVESGATVQIEFF